MSNQISITENITTVEVVSNNPTVLEIEQSNQILVAETGANIPASLGEIRDVDLSPAPTDGQVLTYDATGGVWQPESIPATDLSSLLKLDQSTPQHGIGPFDINVRRTKTLVVDAAGRGDYATIKEACDYVATLTPGSTNQWVIQVQPGSYAEQPFTVPTYCLIKGMGQTPTGNVAHCVQISPVAPWLGGTFITMGSIAAIDNCGILLPLDAAATASGIGLSGNGRYTRCWFSGINSTVGVHNLKVISGGVVLQDCVVFAGGSNSTAVHCSDGSAIKKCWIYTSAAGTDIFAILMDGHNDDTVISFTRFGATSGNYFNYDIKCDDGRVWVLYSKLKTYSGDVRQLDKWATSLSGLQEAVAATDVVSTLKGAAGQTANLLELKDSAGAILASISAAGKISGNAASGGNLTLESSAHATKGKILFGASAYDEVNNRLGIGTNSPLQKLDVNGNATADRMILKTNPSGAADAVSREWVESRTQNLVTNGQGLMGDNYNFSSFTFDPVETHGGGGSFTHIGASSFKTSSELIPIDLQKYYRLVVWGKSGNIDGSEYNPINKQYVGVLPYDADGLGMTPYMYLKYGTSTDTTLAVDLNPGDATITLTDATGWNNTYAGGDRGFAWWPYTNSKGFTYPDYTYSRNITINSLWPVGGITGNVITLNSVWAGVALPAGTSVRNFRAAGTYKYCTLSNISVPNTWTRYEGYIGTEQAATETLETKFPPYTQYIQVLFFNNYTGGTSPDNRIRWSDIWLSEMSSRNLEGAAVGVPGVITTNFQAMGGGDKVFLGKVGVINTTPTSILDVKTVATTNIGIITRGIAGQTGNLFEARNSSDAILTCIDAAGKIGIGTTSPKSLLHISKTAISNAYFDMYSADGFIVESAEGRLQFIASHSGSGGAGMVFTNVPAAGNNTNWHINHVGPYIGDGLLFRYSQTTATGQDSYIASGFVNTLYLKENGNVGIGTTAPASILDIKTTVIADVGIISRGIAGQTGNLFEARNSSDAILAYVDAAGIVKAAGYKSSDASAGLTQTVTVRNAAGDGTTTLTFKNGLLTGVA